MKHLHQRSFRSRAAVAWLLLCLLACLAAPWLASDLPWYVSYEGKSYFPCFAPGGITTVQNPATHGFATAGQVDWKTIQGASCTWAPIPYSSTTPDMLNAGFVSPLEEQTYRDANDSVVRMPLRFRHWLGTTQTGADVLSGILHGTRYSLAIGFLAILLAALIGVPLGAFSGFVGDKGLKISIVAFWMIVAGIIPALFYGFVLRADVLAVAFHEGSGTGLAALAFSCLIAAVVIMLFYAAGRLLSRLPGLRRRMHLPADLLLSRTTEIFATLPRLVLIVTLSALMRPSLFNLILIFAVTGWTELARLVRAEMMKLRNSEFILAATGLGFSSRRIVFRHALPNVLQPVLALLLPGIATLILSESALSYLGLGVPFDTVTWGSLMASGKGNFEAWWVVVFPGLAIFFTLQSLHALAAGLRRE